MTRNTSQLTRTEKDILEFLWDYGSPLTAAEIISLYPNRTWKASYIHLALQSMLKKGVLRIEGFKPTCKNYARTFAPAVTKEAYLIQEMIRDFQLKKEHVHKLLVYLIDSASDLDTITSMQELCKKKKKQLLSETKEESTQ